MKQLIFCLRIPISIGEQAREILNGCHIPINARFLALIHKGVPDHILKENIRNSSRITEWGRIK
jgi:hypothetical protein